VKLDPGTHKEMHSILTLKLGVTHTDSPCPGNPLSHLLALGRPPPQIHGSSMGFCAVPVTWGGQWLGFAQGWWREGLRQVSGAVKPWRRSSAFFLFFSTTKIGDESNLGSVSVYIVKGDICGFLYFKTRRRRRARSMSLFLLWAHLPLTFGGGVLFSI
jgi:hypothetical protein